MRAITSLRTSPCALGRAAHRTTHRAHRTARSRRFADEPGAARGEFPSHPRLRSAWCPHGATGLGDQALRAATEADTGPPPVAPGPPPAWPGIIPWPVDCLSPPITVPRDVPRTGPTSVRP